jgi:16S rRNA (uracil1498-N3)-methyltransferase
MAHWIKRFGIEFVTSHHLPDFGNTGAAFGPGHKFALYVAVREARPPHADSLAVMPRYDFQTPRLYVTAPLVAGATVALEAGQAHYLMHVLRLAAGDPVLIFNGTDGEWKGRIAGSGKAGGAGSRKPAVLLEAQSRPQTARGNLHYLFSPLKRARLDYMVQKAVEMGASRLQPVMMRHTQSERVNLDRMAANAIEAAEQCGILVVPEIMAPLEFSAAVEALAPTRHLVFCDEDAPCADPVAALRAALPDGGASGLAVLIGPEGGFAEEERALLLRRPHTSRIALGPRILRADTAAVAALAIVQAAVGDWR